MTAAEKGERNGRKERRKCYQIKTEVVRQEVKHI